MTESEERKWLKEAGQLAKLSPGEQEASINLIRALAMGMKGRRAAERHAKFLEKKLRSS